MNTDFARQQMVQQQVRAWDVFDAEILDVLAAVPREQFVPAGFEQRSLIVEDDVFAARLLIVVVAKQYFH